MNKSLAALVALLLLFVGGMAFYFAYQKWQHDRQPLIGKSLSPRKSEVTTASVTGRVGNFQLTSRSNTTFSSKELEGHVWLASFFFTTCTASCRQQNEHLGWLHKEFADQGVKFLSISCDPQRDTADVLHRYALDFTSDVEGWNFLTGDLVDIRTIGSWFQLTVLEQTHMDAFALVDKWGNVRGAYRWKDDAEFAKLKRRIRELLAETAPPPDAKPDEPVAVLPSQSPSASKPTSPPQKSSAPHSNSESPIDASQGKPASAPRGKPSSTKTSKSQPSA